MPTITWLGEGEGGAEQTSLGGLALKKDEAVECDNPAVLARAAKNKYFKVEGYEPKEVATDAPTVPSVVGVDVQHPVAKPGEPMREVHLPGPLEEPKPSQSFTPIPPAKK
jgi:hypothetical protein